MSFNILSVDLGQSIDFTAVALLECHPTVYKQRYDVVDEEYRVPVTREQDVEGLPITLDVRHLERQELGTSYPDIAKRIATLMHRKELRAGAILAVDATGVGRAVVDLLEMEGLEPVAITISGGHQVTGEGRRFSVPKRDLIGCLIVASQQHRIRIAHSLPLHPVVQQEMLAFEQRFTQSGNDTYEGRVGQHDDLVLALAIGAWVADAVVSSAAVQAMDAIEWAQVGDGAHISDW